MSDNLFEIALLNNETEKYFKGEGKYFARNPETGEHAFLVHFSGWITSYISDNETKTKQFYNVFRSFIDNSDASDQNNFIPILQNILAYVVICERKGILRSVNLKSNEESILEAFKNYIVQLKNQSFFDENRSHLKEYIEFFNNHDGKLFSDCIVKLLR